MHGLLSPVEENIIRGTLLNGALMHDAFSCVVVNGEIHDQDQGEIADSRHTYKAKRPPPHPSKGEIFLGRGESAAACSFVEESNAREGFHKKFSDEVKALADPKPTNAREKWTRPNFIFYL